MEGNSRSENVNEGTKQNDVTTAARLTDSPAIVTPIVDNQKVFFGNDKFKQPSGNKSSMNKGGKNQLFKSNKVKYK